MLKCHEIWSGHKCVLGLSLLMMALPEMETQLIFGLQGVRLLQGNSFLWKRR